MSTESVWCSKKMWANFYSHRCSRKGVVEREGKFYCKQHDPVAKAKRDTEALTKFEEECDEKSAFIKRQGLCVDYCKNLPIEELEKRIEYGKLAQ